MSLCSMVSGAKFPRIGEAVRFYGHGTAAASRLNSSMHSSRNATHRLWLNSQYHELYRDISEFSTLVSSLPAAAASASSSSSGSRKRRADRDRETATSTATQLSILVELFMMILHVNPDDLQRFAGKYGEDEARHAAATLEDPWAGSRDARHAQHQQHQEGVAAAAHAARAGSAAASTAAVIMPPPPSTRYVLLDGDESRETRAFLQLDKGVPGLSTGSASGSGLSAADGIGGGSGAESLSNPGMVLDIARNVFRENYPMRSEPLPPLVESLGNLLRDLGTGLAGRPSRVPSRAVSETPS
ncbi:hypothetical protein PG987_016299 [Apiospora arundinis]